MYIISHASIFLFFLLIFRHAIYVEKPYNNNLLEPEVLNDWNIITNACK